MAMLFIMAVLEPFCQFPAPWRRRGFRPLSTLTTSRGAQNGHKMGTKSPQPIVVACSRS
jgi:hypothetical protein